MISNIVNDTIIIIIIVMIHSIYYYHYCYISIRDCGVGQMGKLMGMAMGLDLWGSMGLRCGTYGVHRGLWDCGVGPMGFIGVYGAAVCDLCGNVWGWLWG